MSQKCVLLLQIFHGRFQAFKKFCKSFLTAGRVFNDNALCKQAGNGKAHGESMIVMGFYMGGFRYSGIDGYGVGSLLATDTHGSEIFGNGT